MALERKNADDRLTARALTLAGNPVAGKPDATISPIGAYATPDHRYYFNGIGPVPSVTTVLGILDKPAVGIWRAKGSARALLEADGFIPDEWSEDERVGWALAQIDEYRDQAADLGSSVHLLANIAGRDESDSKAFPIGERELPYVDAFRRFLDRYSASNIVSSEHAVWSANGYGGTFDLIMRIDDELALLDIKTSSGAYAETALQLAGYRWADSIILPGDPHPYPMPAIDRCYVLHLRPDRYPDIGYRLIEYPVEYERDYISFLACLELYRWKRGGFRIE